MTSPFFHARSSETYPILSGVALTALPFTDTVACRSSLSAYEYNVVGTGRFRAHPGIRSLMVPLTSSLVETVSVDMPPHGISLSTDSDRSFAPTLNDVLLDT